jgi:ADP-ribose pyrophosphatase YjhB (NUDIX family)
MGVMHEEHDEGSWLSESEITFVRSRLPILYVDAIPVRVDEKGQVTNFGLLLRAMPNGSISRAMVSGRVHHKERVRDALLRHIGKDLGVNARPLLPTNPVPFTVVEYFPSPEVTGYFDPRQHAVSLAFIVPVEGECAPSQSVLDFTWITLEDALNPQLLLEMSGGQDKLLRQAMSHLNLMP